MRAEGAKLFPNKFVAFRTEMEIIGIANASNS